MNVEIQALLNVTRAIGHHLNRDVLFGALAECLQTAVPTECFGIVLPADQKKLQAYILRKDQLMSEGVTPVILDPEGTSVALGHVQP